MATVELSKCSKRAAIVTIVDLRVRLRGREEQGLRNMVSSSSVKVNSVPGPELSQLPSKSALTKRAQCEFSLYYALLIQDCLFTVICLYV